MEKVQNVGTKNVFTPNLLSLLLLFFAFVICALYGLLVAMCNMYKFFNG